MKGRSLAATQLADRGPERPFCGRFFMPIKRNAGPKRRPKRRYITVRPVRPARPIVQTQHQLLQDLLPGRGEPGWNRNSSPAEAG